MQFGPIPPVAGAARQQFLLERGANAGRAAAVAMAESERQVRAILGDVEFPYMDFVFVDNHDLEERHSRWSALRRRLLEATAPGEAIPGEAAARRALVYATNANYDLRETGRARAAHIRLHRYGEFVSGLYMCLHEQDGGTWYMRCAVNLSHNRLGLSPGFTATRACSISGEDYTECEHLPNEWYPIECHHDASGVCNICGGVDCEHAPGSVWQVHPHVELKDAVMHEGSLTPRPREPRARITGIEIEVFEGERCITCLYPCTGPVVIDPTQDPSADA
jgi:hypothetical protein